MSDPSIEHTRELAERAGREPNPATDSIPPAFLQIAPGINAKLIAEAAALVQAVKGVDMRKMAGAGSTVMDLPADPMDPLTDYIDVANLHRDPVLRPFFPSRNAVRAFLKSRTEHGFADAVVSFQKRVYLSRRAFLAGLNRQRIEQAEAEASAAWRRTEPHRSPE